MTKAVSLDDFQDGVIVLKRSVGFVDRFYKTMYKAFSSLGLEFYFSCNDPLQKKRLYINNYLRIDSN